MTALHAVRHKLHPWPHNCSVTSPPDISAMSPDVMGPSLLSLLDGLNATMFCAKDAEGRYVAVNPTFVRRAGARSRRAVIGRKAGDLFVPDLALRYEEQDARVLGGARLTGELELIRALNGRPRWHLTSKVPVRDRGTIVGLVSISQDLGDTRENAAFPALALVLASIEGDLASPPAPATLAELAQMPPAALSRRLRRVTGLSTSQLILRSRVDRAAHLLAHSRTPIAEIAALTGFYDQAALSRQFARLAGETPASYRRREAHVTKP